MKQLGYDSFNFEAMDGVAHDDVIRPFATTEPHGFTIGHLGDRIEEPRQLGVVAHTGDLQRAVGLHLRVDQFKAVILDLSPDGLV